PIDPKQFVAELVPRVRKLMTARPELTVEGIGVSLPGRVDLATKKLVFAPNLGWQDFDLKTPLEKATRLPVELENAANSCALSEIASVGALKACAIWWSLRSLKGSAAD